MALAPKKDFQVIEIPPIRKERIVLRVVGDTELITHNWNQKAITEMEAKQGGKAREKKAPKVPEDEFQGAFYRLDDGTPACKAIAFKAAAVEAAMTVEGMTKAHVRRTFHVIGELLPIEGEAYMRRDMVRIGMGVADIRYRPGFKTWAVNVPIVYDASIITLEQLIHLFNKAGFSVGVHEWRSEKDGMYGLFHVETAMPAAA